MQKVNNEGAAKLKEITETLIKYQKEQNSKKVSKGGSIASKQKELEVLDDNKEKLMSQNEENSSKTMNQICEHGQILMTINNLYLKVKREENWKIVEKGKSTCNQQYQEPGDAQKNFDNIDQVVSKALDQMKEIERFVKSYKLLNELCEKNDKAMKSQKPKS